jgi:hypothetical protein
MVVDDCSQAFWAVNPLRAGILREPQVIVLPDRVTMFTSSLAWAGRCSSSWLGRQMNRCREATDDLRTACQLGLPASRQRISRCSTPLLVCRVLQRPVEREVRDGLPLRDGGQEMWSVELHDLGDRLRLVVLRVRMPAHVAGENRPGSTGVTMPSSTIRSRKAGSTPARSATSAAEYDVISGSLVRPRSSRVRLSRGGRRPLPR